MSKLASIRVVLVRPEKPGNVGAAARAMRNFGMNHLVLVAPAYPRPQDAYTWARGAEDVIESADIVEDLATAVAPCTRVWATTRRTGRHRHGALSVREAGAEAKTMGLAGEPGAWVFGPEPSGLQNDDLSRCSARVAIPTAPEQPSMNLAQAVAICAYESWSASVSAPDPEARRIAPVRARQDFYDHLEETLMTAGFLEPHTTAARMPILRALFERSRLDDREVRMLRGLLRQFVWSAQHVDSQDEGPDGR